MRVLSYNVHKGFCARNRRFLLNEIRDSIRDVDADLVFLQEVVGENQRHAEKLDDWIDESQFEYLADQVWPHYAYGRNAIYQHGHHGNAILSKWHVCSQSNHNVSLIAPSQRGVLLTEIENGVYLICLHFGLLGWERRRQFQMLMDVIERNIPADAPLIIAGDFNDWNLSLQRRFIKAGFREAFTEKRGKPARSFPANRPLLRLDRMYLRGLEVKNAKVLKGEPWRNLSDHCPLFVELALTSE
ncbi:endonuclease/exonuclease/phosphatase family protein [Spongiibacter sp. KMU-158]|uniref:Endonuclease/exonuclease/phosphatase family protein n=1 Tax=Spongiibacter pelagi TaxID=2760804 RepID=A0A927C255_9GAMM|nr:endonuclease/exonuclease/phosphatase family protein [Spongiibacter pelagi]MBD2859905.1 endonuclease/exonuclease/phosphatase family protein [Spongiibacter pelagi]